MNTQCIATLLVVLLVTACGDDSATGNNNQVDSQTICGNGELELGEQCDDGESNSDSLADACRTDCRLAYCGDRVVDADESCDDGPSNSDFIAGACRADCQPFHCGDGVPDPGEECDDANATAGDGCSDQCLVEENWQCSGAPSMCVCQSYRDGDACEQCIVFVDQAAAGAESDGLTWGSAYHTVQEGIDAAFESGPGCEVWVAAGTYRVMQSSIFNTLELRSGVGIYGGFAGTETERSQRDWQTNVTILDGEHATEDTAVMHVVTAFDTVDATLDGFVVQWGFAQGPRAEDNLGAGLQAFGAAMTIENCRFVDNYALGAGGGLYAYGSTLTIRDTSFADNIAQGDGAGLLLALSTVELSRCEIWGNQAALDLNAAGAGLNIQASEVHAVNSLIVNNTTPGNGGGIYHIYSSVSLLHCTVAGNSATLGDGDSIYRDGNSPMEITSSLIVGNHFPASATLTTVSYSVMPSSWPGTGTGNVVATPSFVGAGDYHLTNNSQGIDRADGLAAPAEDLDGNPRYNDPNRNDIYDCANQPACVSYADCGAYERQQP